MPFRYVQHEADSMEGSWPQTWKTLLSVPSLAVSERSAEVTVTPGPFLRDILIIWARLIPALRFCLWSSSWPESCHEFLFPGVRVILGPARTRLKALFESQIPGLVEMTRKWLHQPLGFQNSQKKANQETRRDASARLLRVCNWESVPVLIYI